jgi:hypothetical protein
MQVKQASSVKIQTRPSEQAISAHVASCGWSSMAVWVDSRANVWWFPPIYMRGGAPNGDTLHTSTIHSSLEFSLELRVVLESFGVEVLRRSALTVLFSKLYLYKSEGDSRWKFRVCRHSSPLVPRRMLIWL